MTFQHVGGYLAGCTVVICVDLSSPMPAFRSIGHGFLCECTSVIDFGPHDPGAAVAEYVVIRRHIDRLERPR
jgi:hypothetical protein